MGGRRPQKAVKDGVVGIVQPYHMEKIVGVLSYKVRT